MKAPEPFDVEYLRHGEAPLLARIFSPSGVGPHPALLMVHGGGWTLSDRTQEPLCAALADAGVLVVSIDFRMPPAAVYPASIADANLAVRWLKLHAERYGTVPGAIGAIGTSSGAHMALLGAMRPHDPRYAELALSGGEHLDARVGFVVACWPVIDPLGRYQYLQRVGDDLRGEIDAGRIIDFHRRYWQTEDAMSDGSPLRILERGEPVLHPDLLYVQATRDHYHPHAHFRRFAELYRRAGGSVEIELVEAAYDPPPAPAFAVGRIAAFVHAHTRAAIDD